MKGIAHFLTGLALATLFPEVVNAAESGSLLPVLGGLGGLLPDTLDFKFVQFWEKYHVEVDPGPEPNAEAIADTVIQAMHHAYEIATPVHMRTHTIRLSADTWRRYTLGFDPEKGDITVSIGPVVSTSRKPYSGDDITTLQTARRKFAVPFHVPYAQSYDVDIFQGPSFLFAREGNALSVRFLDWHRRWTHSLLLTPIFGLCIALVTGWLTNWATAVWAGIISWLGFSAHVLQDQLGFLGSNLWWPLSRYQQPGLGFFHASDALPNFITVWLSVILILYNLDRFNAISFIPGIPYLVLGLGVPVIVAVVAVMRHRHQKTELMDS